MLRPWVQMNDLHLHGLDLQVFGWDPGDFVCDLISFYWDILALDIRDVNKDVISAIGGADEAMTL